MPRGRTPRQPGRTGHQDRVARSPLSSKPAPQKSRGARIARVGTAALGGPRGEAPAAAPKSRKAGTTPAYNPLAPERIAEILKRLDQLYPDVTCALTHKSAWELLVATILSAQSTDETVNRVTKTLFAKYRTPNDFAYANPAEMERDIHATGFFRNKTKSIMGAGKKIAEEFGGEVPRTMDELLTLPGVARKTANVVLGTAFGIAVGVVVDTHVMRLSNRLDLSRNTDPKKIEQDLMQVIPREKWVLFSHQLIWHGRRVCQARKPKCVACNLEPLCYSKDKTV